MLELILPLPLILLSVKARYNNTIRLAPIMVEEMPHVSRNDAPGFVVPGEVWRSCVVCELKSQVSNTCYLVTNDGVNRSTVKLMLMRK